MARLYGVTHVCSHGTVTNGFVDAMRSAGKLEGLVDLSFVPDADAPLPGGALASDAVYTGALARMAVMEESARHERRIVMVAPNSTRLPIQLVRSLDRYATHLLAPSTWAREVLQQNCQQPVWLAQHGISDEYYACDEQFCEQSYRDEEFVVMHYSTSGTQRKGTRELVQAWRQVYPELPPKAVLALVMDDPYSLLWRDLKDEACNVYLIQRSNHTAETFRNVMGHAHLVAQPSRGEGFGLVPLEARACGCPVLMTGCSGHADHIGTVLSGCVRVAHGADEAIDEGGPGSKAPRIEVDDIADKLLFAYQHWTDLKLHAMARSDEQRKEWSWKTKLRELTMLVK